MINNYKAQRNVRAELSGAVDLGEPVSLYIKEDEVAVASKNLITNGDFSVDADPLWLTGTGGNGVEGWSISGGKATKSAPEDNSGIEQSNIFENGKTYQVNFTISDRTQGSIAVYRGQGTQLIYSSGSSSMNDSHSLCITSYTTAHKILFNGTDNFNGSIDNVSVYEVLDHSYKLMAANDSIPYNGVNAEGIGVMSDLLSSDTKTALNDVLNGTNNVIDFQDGSDGFNLITANGFTKPLGNGATFVINSNLGRLSNGAANQGQVSLAFTTVSGRTYDISLDIEAVNSTELQASLGATSAYNSDAAVTTSGVDNDYHLSTRFTATGTTSYLYLQLNTSTSGHYVDIDDLMIYEVYGYDYWNAPAYKFGIVSSIYDKDTGAMKTTGAAGDQLDVTVQGECTLHKSGTYSLSAGRIISRIWAGSSLDSATPSSSDGDLTLPNAVAVTSETTSSSNTQPIILFQGVEFSEHFVHKNSLQVHAKCDETITKFRPVSLFLDSNGDLLCRHDNIPAEVPDADTDHTGADPGKWGISELGGVSGDIIPVTVAGKTTFNCSDIETEGNLILTLKEDGSAGHTGSTDVSPYTPNALGTFMESGTGDVPITIFGGTPIGTITDWKRTIKVTAKANGAITQYCPVSLYLDQYGEYKCISDDIPNEDTSASNAIWVDFRKWGIAQETVADGENVEIIVQGRTNVVDSKDSGNRGEFVRKITSAGVVSTNDSTSHALSCIGIVEKESKTSDGTPGTIIIF